MYRHQNATHFWLNEGWTTYIERVLQQFLHSPAHRGFSYLIGYKSLQDALREFKDRPKYQRLVIDFEEGEDPDDAYSVIPYEKGSIFLLYLGVFLPLKCFIVGSDCYQKGSWVALMSSFHMLGTMSIRSWAEVSTHGCGKIIFTAIGVRMEVRRR